MMDNRVNNRSENGEEEAVAVVPMQVDAFHYTNGSDEGEESAASLPNAMPRASELTISFEGEVYVFPAVTPDKVRITLFILFTDYIFF